MKGPLVTQLAADEITRQKFIHAMERLAAGADASNPLVVPPEAGSVA